MVFQSEPSLRRRTPFELRVIGQPDKPYEASWYYPAKPFGSPSLCRRRMSEDRALEFALKHKLQHKDVPHPLRRKLCRFARTVAAIASTTIVRRDDATV